MPFAKSLSAAALTVLLLCSCRDAGQAPAGGMQAPPEVTVTTKRSDDRRLK